MTMRRICGVLMLACAVAIPARAQYPDLNAIPENAVLSGHILAGELLKGESFNLVRKVIEKAGPEAWKTFQSRFSPNPANLDRISFFMLFPARKSDQPEFAVTITSKEAIIPAKLFNTADVKMTEEKIEGKSVWTDKRKEVGVFFPDSKTLVIGPPKLIANLKPRPDSPAAAALAAVGPELPMIIHFNRKAVPEEFAREEVPPELKPLLAIDSATLGWGMGKSLVIKLAANYANEQAAKDALQVTLKWQEMGRQELPRLKNDAMRMLLGEKGRDTYEDMPKAFGGLMSLGLLNWADEILSKPIVTQAGARLGLDIPVPNEFVPAYAALPILAGISLPAVQKVREAAGRAQDANNLKQIALSLHNYESAYQVMPQSANYDKNGKPLLSWRVHLLPYLEQEALYRQFKLDEPWDSEHNKKLIPLMPKTFLATEAPATPAPGMTYIRAPFGPNTIFDPKNKLAIAQIQDGSSNTCAFYLAQDPIVWTKPEQLEYDPKNPLPKLATWMKMPLIAMCDGSVRSVRSDIDPKKWKWIVDPADGQTVIIDE